MSTNQIDSQSLLLQMRAMADKASSGTRLHEIETPQDSFGDLLGQAIDSVNTRQQNASALAQAFERGDPEVDIAEVMIALQKANVSFEAITQVRNRLVSAYQEIMNMSI